MSAKWDTGTSDEALKATVKMDIVADTYCHLQMQFEIPFDIHAALKSEDFDRIEAWLTGYAQKCWTRGKLMLYPTRLLKMVIMANVERMFKDAMYRVFVAIQARKGVQEWQVPVQSMAQET